MQAWFESIVGPELALPVMWVVIAIVALIVLMIVLRIIRAFSSGTFVMGGRGRKARLAVMDATAVDANRRLVLVRRDDVEHLILIGGPTDVVVEQGIRPYAASRQTVEPAAPAVPVPNQAPRNARPEAAPVHSSVSQPAQRVSQPAPAPVREPVNEPAAPRATQPAPAIERAPEPSIEAADRRETTSAYATARAEPTLAPLDENNRKPADQSIEDEMARLLNDFTPDQKR